MSPGIVLERRTGVGPSRASSMLKPSAMSVAMIALVLVPVSRERFVRNHGDRFDPTA